VSIRKLRGSWLKVGSTGPGIGLGIGHISVIQWSGQPWYIRVGPPMRASRSVM